MTRSIGSSEPCLSVRISKLSSATTLIGQANLVQKQLQAGLESNSLELELDGIVGLDVEPLERSQVKDDGQAQISGQTLDDLGQRRGPARIGKHKVSGERPGPIGLDRLRASVAPLVAAWAPWLSSGVQLWAINVRWLTDNKTHHQAGDKEYQGSGVSYATPPGKLRSSRNREEHHNSDKTSTHYNAPARPRPAGLAGQDLFSMPCPDEPGAALSLPTPPGP